MMDPNVEPIDGGQENTPRAGGVHPEIRWDDGLGFRTITGDTTPDNELLKLIAERIRVAARHLGLTRDDLFRIFSRHSIFEGEADEPGVGGKSSFILVETHHLIQGRVGKGALKLVFPQDLLGQESHFQESEPGVVEVVHPPGMARWTNAAEAEALVKQAMREFMTGESLSMSLKSQATDAPFAGSEGLMLCAAREFDEASGRYRLKSLLQGGEENAREDKELIERMMNGAAEMLTRTHRIAYDKIVHAAETNYHSGRPARSATCHQRRGGASPDPARQRPPDHHRGRGYDGPAQGDPGTKKIFANGVHFGPGRRKDAIGT